MSVNVYENLASQGVSSLDKGGVEGAVCSFFTGDLTRWCVLLLSVDLLGARDHLTSRAVWILDRRGAQ